MNNLKIIGLTFLMLCTITRESKAQTNVAAQRAKSLGLGVNLSYLEAFWTLRSDTGNFVNINVVKQKKSVLAAIARQGFKSVRLPVCFSAWLSKDAPYRWTQPQNLSAVDSMIKWAQLYKLKIIIDNHAIGYRRGLDSAKLINLARVEFMWRQIATRYKNTNPNNVIFELWNEPENITDDAWYNTARVLIRDVRAIALNHSIIVGNNHANSLDALLLLKPFDDDNIIYTFHYYRPKLFTEQADAHDKSMQSFGKVGFPYNQTLAAKRVVSTNKYEKWLYGDYLTYTPNAIKQDFVKVKKWATNNNVPVFCGEFGVTVHASPGDRCNYYSSIINNLSDLNIPGTAFEWGDMKGFPLTDGQNNLLPNIKPAVASYNRKFSAR